MFVWVFFPAEPALRYMYPDRCSLRREIQWEISELMLQL